MCHQSPLPINASKYLTRATALVCLLGLYLVACKPLVTETTTPTATVALTTPARLVTTAAHDATPATSRSDTPADHTTPVAATIFTSQKYSYTITLPQPWIVSPTNAPWQHQLVATLRDRSYDPGNSALTTYKKGAAHVELVAYRPHAAGTQPDHAARLSVSIVDATGLTLQTFLKNTQAELARNPNIKVYTAKITTTELMDGQPAALLEYTITRENSAAAHSISIYQASTIAEGSRHLIVITFATGRHAMPVWQPRFRAILKAATLH